MDGIEGELLEGVAHIRIDGSTSSAERAKRVNAFQTQEAVADSRDVPFHGKLII